MADGPTLKLVTEKAAADQASAQRRARGGVPRLGTRARRVISVGGGKGGIGKSLIASNLGIELARRGRRVVLVDADLGGANLHTCLGVEAPKRTLSDFIERRTESIEDVVTPTGIPNLGLVSGALDHIDAANPRYAQKMRLLRHVQAMDVDYAIMDLGAGTHLNVLDFFLVSDHGVLVLVPEPTSVENAYRFVKAAFWRRMRNVVSVYGYDPLLRSLLSTSAFQSPLELVNALAEHDPEAGENLARQLAQFRPRLIVNQARSAQDIEMGTAVVSAWRKYFGLEMDYLGAIDYDDEMWRTVRARRPLLIEQPGSRAARAFGRLVDGLLALDGMGARGERHR
jgi:flagellar biosynthesis protein FlhG